MRGTRAKRLRRQVRSTFVIPYEKRKIKVGRAYGGPAMGAFPYPKSYQEGDPFDVITLTEAELETIRQRTLSDEQTDQDIEPS